MEVRFPRGSWIFGKPTIRQSLVVIAPRDGADCSGLNVREPPKLARHAPAPALGELPAAPSLAAPAGDGRGAGGARLRPRLPAALRPRAEGRLPAALRAHAAVGGRAQPGRLRRPPA